jgi:tripartite-type tricarboxylate transporter receptor subunit TctC
MSTRLFFKTLMACAIGLTLTGAAQAQQWKPTRPINLIVPWAAGGSTDQVTRVTAAELEKALGQTIVIVNQPGASGSIGTKSALDAPKDGYTWAAGAAQDLGAYETLGIAEDPHHRLAPVPQRGQHPGDRRQPQDPYNRTPRNCWTR